MNKKCRYETIRRETGRDRLTMMIYYIINFAILVYAGNTYPPHCNGWMYFMGKSRIAILLQAKLIYFLLLDCFTNS